MVMFVFGACSRHDGDLPTEVNYVRSATPATFTVTSPDQITYDLSWTISDPSTVSEYRVWLFVNAGQTFGFVPWDTVMTTSYSETFASPVPDAVWAVTSVSTDNVESEPTCAATLGGLNCALLGPFIEFP